MTAKSTVTRDGAVTQVFKMLRKRGTLLFVRLAVVSRQWGKAPLIYFILYLSSCSLAPDMDKVAESAWQRVVNKDSCFLPKDQKWELQGPAKYQGNFGEVVYELLGSP